MRYIFNTPGSDSSDIPMWVMIWALIFAPPIGIVLLILKAIWSADDRKTKAKKSSINTANASRSHKNMNNSKRSGYSVLRFLLYTLSVICVFNGLGSISDLIKNGVSLAAVADVVIPFIVSGASFLFARVHKNRADRCDSYSILIGDKPYFSVAALAAASGVSYNRAKKDLQYMISRGRLGPEAFIDSAKKMLFSSPEAAAEYEKAFVKVAVEDEKPFEDKIPQDEYRHIIREIRRLNDEIADIDVSDRIYKIEEHTANIFDYVKEHPEKKGSIRMLMNYYLPTTLKLLTSYANIERVGVAGDNMRKSKESIEETLDMLVFAFEKELDRLYESESIDINSDIEVLEKMLKKDGMTKGWSDDIYSSASAVMNEEDKESESEA